MSEHKTTKNPIIYSCSGCSSAAQLANHLAIFIDRKGLAEMSCIAGVGGDVPSLVRVAKSGRKIISLDGCQLKCVQSCLKRHGITANMQLILSDYEVKKEFHKNFNENDFKRIASDLEQKILNIKK